MRFKRLTSFLCTAALTVSSFAGLQVSASADEAAKNVTVAVNVGDATAKVTSGETEELTGVLIHAKYAENVLESVKVSSEFATPQNSVDIGFAYSSTDKLFMWNSLSGMVPYNVTIEPKTAAPTAVNTVAGVTITSDGNYPAELTATVAAINDSDFTDTTAFTYAWSKDGGAVSGGTDGTLANAEAGNYTVTATYNGTGNYTGSITSNPFAVSAPDDTRVDIAGKVTVSVISDKLTAGATLTASITAGETDLSEADFTYVWSKNGSPISGGENGTLEDAQAGDYTVVATVKSDNESYKGSTAASQAVTIKAVYTVTWNVDGETTQESYADGETPSYSGTPSKAQTDTDTFEFTDWNPAIAAVNGDITYTAQFSSQKKSYTVTYNKNEGTIANESNYTSYTCGTTLTLPTPTRNGYTFGGWYENSNFDGTEITSIGADAYGNKVYYAKWEQNQADTYTVTWKNGSETLETDSNVASGSHPSYDGSEPTKESADKIYTFTGWKKANAQGEAVGEIVNLATETITENTTYLAQFSESTRQYSATFKLAGGNISGNENDVVVPTDYNTVPQAPVPTRDGFAFAAWNPVVSAITADTNYTATWKVATPNIAIDYVNEVLTGFGSGSYTIEDVDVTSKIINNSVPVDLVGASYFNSTIRIVKKGTGDDADSEAQQLPVPARHAAPTSSDITVTQPTTIGGSGTISGVTDAMEYKKDGDATYTSGDGTAITAVAGDTYYVRYKAVAGESFASSDYTVPTITAYTPDKEVTPSIEINYINETLTGFTAGATYTITVDGTPADVTPDASAISATDYIGKTISIVKKGNGTTTANSTAQSLDVDARPTAPNGLDSTAESSSTAKDGTITGVDDTMEYKLVSASDWTAVTESATTITGLEAGAYVVRTKATDNAFAGIEAHIDVTREGSRTIKFVDYDSSTISSQVLENGATVTVPENPTREQDDQYSYTFKEWMPTVVTTVAGDATYTATYDKTPRVYTVTLNLGEDASWSEESKNITSYTYSPDQAVTLPTEGMTYAGHTFTGWKNLADDDVTEIAAGTTGDKTYNAQWSTNTYTITWSIDGTETSDTDVAYGTQLTHVEPTKDGGAQHTYTFLGWSETSATDEAGATKSLPTATKTTTYYAVFKQTTNSYTITWLNDDDTQIDTTEVAYGEVPTHAAPSKTNPNNNGYNYTFTGWDTVPVAVTGTATYKATFSASAKTFDITYNINGHGTAPTEKLTYTYAAGLAELPELTETGYTFNGWYTAAEDGNKVESITAEEYGDKELYAQWTPIEYKITFNGTDGATGMDDAPEKYTIETEDITLPTPKKDGFEFAGWYEKENPTEEDTAVETIAKGTTGNKTFYAQWTEEKEYVVGAVDEENEALYKWTFNNVASGDITSSTSDDARKFNDKTTYKSDYADLTVSLGNNDTMSEGTITFNGTGITDTDGKTVEETKRYIVVTPKVDGDLSITVQTKSTSTCRVYVHEFDNEVIDLSVCIKDTSSDYYFGGTTFKNETKTLVQRLSKNHTYVIYVYTSNTGSTISNVNFIASDKVITGDYDSGVYTWNIGKLTLPPAKGTPYTDSNDYADLAVYLGASDSMDGTINYARTSVGETSTLDVTSQYILVQPKTDGVFNVSVSFNGTKGRIYYKDITEELKSDDFSIAKYKKEDPNAGTTSDNASNNNTENLMSIKMEAEHSYIVYTYQTSSVSCKIHSLSYNVIDDAIKSNYENGIFTWGIGKADAASIKGIAYKATTAEGVDPDKNVDLTVYLGANDSMDGEMINYSVTSVGESSGNGQKYTSLAVNEQYILVQPKVTGIFNVGVSFDGSLSSGAPGRIYYQDITEDLKTANEAGTSLTLSNYKKAEPAVVAGAVNSQGTTENIISIPMEAGKAYIVFTYQTSTPACRIHSLTYTADPDSVITISESEGTYSWNIGSAPATSIPGIKYNVSAPSETIGAALAVSLGKNDYMTQTEEGGEIHLTGTSVLEADSGNNRTISTTGRYIVVTANENGQLKAEISFDGATNSAKCRLYYKEFDSVPTDEEIGALTRSDATAATSDITSSNSFGNASINMTKGKTYVMYTYQKASTIKNLTFTPTKE